METPDFGKRNVQVKVTWGWPGENCYLLKDVGNNLLALLFYIKMHSLALLQKVKQAVCVSYFVFPILKKTTFSHNSS